MLTRSFDPWAALDRAQRDMDLLFGGQRLMSPRAAPFPAINVWEQGDAIVVEAEVPGLRLENIDILVVGNELTVKGHREEGDAQQAIYHRRERGTGAFTRVLTLPLEVDPDKVEATLTHGILTIRLPKAESAQARKIQVKAG